MMMSVSEFLVMRTCKRRKGTRGRICNDATCANPNSDVFSSERLLALCEGTVC
jgi:hypothetical protein